MRKSKKRPSRRSQLCRKPNRHKSAKRIKTSKKGTGNTRCSYRSGEEATMETKMHVHVHVLEDLLSKAKKYMVVINDNPMYTDLSQLPIDRSLFSKYDIPEDHYVSQSGWRLKLVEAVDDNGRPIFSIESNVPDVSNVKEDIEKLLSYHKERDKKFKLDSESLKELVKELNVSLGRMDTLHLYASVYTAQLTREKVDEFISKIEQQDNEREKELAQRIGR